MTSFTTHSCSCSKNAKSTKLQRATSLSRLSKCHSTSPLTSHLSHISIFSLVSPRRRRRSRSRTSRNQRSLDEDLLEDTLKSPHESRTILMSNSEALHSLYGEIATIRDGDLTHQCIQTNLADVICGGNPNDKIMYPRSSKRRSASFPTPRSLERRHSLRLFGSSKRLQRCQSTRSLSKNSTLQPQPSTTNTATAVTDSSSSEYQSTDSSSPSESLYFRCLRPSFTNQRLTLAFVQKKVPLYSREFSVEAVATRARKLKVSLRNSRLANGSTQRPFISSTSARKQLITR
jgi:hypothetical protein